MAQLTTFEIITLDVQQCRESLSQRSDVYNGVRVRIRADRFGRMEVCVGKHPIDFSSDVTSLDVARYIQSETLKNFKNEYC